MRGRRLVMRWMRLVIRGRRLVIRGRRADEHLEEEERARAEAVEVALAVDVLLRREEGEELRAEDGRRSARGVEEGR